MVKYVTITPRRPEHTQAAEIMEAVVNIEMNDPAVRDQLLRAAVDEALRDTLSASGFREPPDA